MDVRDFPAVEVQAKGRYRLVPEELLEQALRKGESLNQVEKVSGMRTAAVRIEPQNDTTVTESAQGAEPSTVGELLRFYREKHNLSMKALNRRTGLHRGHMAKLELESHPELQFRTIRKLSEVYGAEFRAALRKLGIRVPDDEQGTS